MTDKLIEYLKERIKTLDVLKYRALEEMEKTYTEEGAYRDEYFKYLDKKIEVQDILLKVYELKKEYNNE